MIQNKDIPEDFDLNDVKEKDLKVKNVCSLWAGMGYVYNIQIRGDFHIIVKHIIPPPTQSRSFGDERKAASYEVEANFAFHSLTTLRMTLITQLQYACHVWLVRQGTCLTMATSTQC
jgi:hypothetical protein